MPDGGQAPEARDTIEAIYAALAAGDADAIRARLAPGFVGRFAEGMPAGGGTHHGADAAIADGWWAIGRAFRARAEPEELIACAGGRVLVRGRYRGNARDGAKLDASFMHLWTIDASGAVTALQQETDTAQWLAARRQVTA